MNKTLMFSQNTDEWETPQEFFDLTAKEFGPFIADVAAQPNNAKCKTFFNDGLYRPWPRGVVWCNPPYSRGMQKLFIEKAFEERKNGVTTVMLIPARTDTQAFHTYIYNKKNVEIRFIKGRLKFGGSKNSAPYYRENRPARKSAMGFPCRTSSSIKTH